jgi:nucleotide-binding universal stress UspA family protein
MIQTIADPPYQPDSTGAMRGIEASLIVTGSLGRHRITGMLIGNTAERVLRRMPCAVLTVKEEPEE